GVESLPRGGGEGGARPAVAGPPAEGCPFSPETGHSLCPPFRAYWERNGGLATFGFPISEPAPEQVEGARSLTVQYFERARFEDHADQPAARRVQLSRLGAELRP
ncbi:MAG TPA: peptidase S8, partial [Chloroflexaceae bacterium]|nr:peptidase S8 [Chloroflexaceae bacterium]